MRHPTEGTLRRLLDEPAGVADTERQHVAGCATCLSALAAVQQDASAAGAALDLDVAPDVDAGWRRLSRAVASKERPAAVTASTTRTVRTAPVPRWRAALRSPAVAAVGVVAILSGAGAAAAADWLPFFRTEQVAPVAITEADLMALPDLSAYGDLEVVSEPDVREVADAAAAADVTGLSVPVVDQLPQGVTGDPVLQVGDQVTAVFTFSSEKAEQAAAASGETLPEPPAGMDGSRFRLEAGPGVAQVWSGSQGVPAMVVARAVAPTASSSGVPFAAARDYLLAQPGMPDDVAAQLRAFSADGTTLPLPLPADRVTTSEAEVDGVPATVVTTRDGTMAGVVWVDEGVVTAVIGSLSEDEVLQVAERLRTR